MRELIYRFRAKTPKFFKKIRNLSLAVAGASTAASVFYSNLSVDMASLIPVSIVKAIAIAGFTAAFVAQITKEDTSV